MGEDRHRAGSAAMAGAGEGDGARTAGRGRGDTRDHLDGVRARVARTRAAVARRIGADILQLGGSHGRQEIIDLRT